MTRQPGPIARALLDRMKRDVARMDLARKRVRPLVEQIAEAYHRFPQNGSGHPTRLHVSREIYKELLGSFYPEAKGSIRACGRPVYEIPDLGGFRWVRERLNSWECGPVHVLQEAVVNNLE